MRLIWSLLACLSLLIACTTATDDSVFTNPPKTDNPTSTDFSNNPVYSVGQPLNVQWTSSYAEVTVLLEQYQAGFRPVLTQSVPNTGSLQWNVSYNDFGNNLAPNGLPVMRFLLFEAPSQTHIYSHFFNLSSPPPNSGSATTSSVSVSTASISSASISNTAGAAQVNSATFATSTVALSTSVSISSTTSPSPDSKIGGTAAPVSAAPTSSAASPTATAEELNSSTKAGLGVGLGIGIPLLGVLGAILFLLLRRRGQEYQPHGETWPPKQDISSQERGFAAHPPMHAVPILQPPPPTRSISHVRHPTNEDGYAPPSAKLKPWPEAFEVENVETRAYDAYGRPKGFMYEAQGDYGDPTGRYELGEGRASYGPKELPALPQTPK